MRAFAITYIMLSSFIHLSLHMHRLVIACRINQKLSLAEKGWERKRERGRGVYIRTYVRTYIHAFYLYVYIHIYMYNICMYMGVHMATMFHVNKMLGPWHVWSPWRSGGALVGWVEQFRSRSPGEEEGMDGMDRAGTFFIETEIDRGKKEIERDSGGWLDAYFSASNCPILGHVVHGHFWEVSKSMNTYLWPQTCTGILKN